MDSNPTSPITSRRGSPKNVANLYECFDDLTSLWREKALCRNGSLSTDHFFSINSDNKSASSAAKAISMCSACPVQVECLHEAIKYNYDGVWGGTIYRQRLYFIRQYLNNDLLNLTIEKAKQFVQIAKIQNLRITSPKRKYRRKTTTKNDLLPE